ncbi:MAG: glycosyltransferase family 2 protein [Muribaculaceae bacterium]|nr:glycosyltransferase family 2 protein [Muribaculaceae bacterium]
MLTLDVAISTHKREGLERAGRLLLPPRNNVRYVISVQNLDSQLLPSTLIDREDVKIVVNDTTGLSNNRNVAIDNCSGEVILIADDDVIYNPKGLNDLIKVFEEQPGLDMALLKVNMGNRKLYPHSGCKLAIPFPKNYYISSVEIAIRRSSLNDLKFYPELGLGSQEMHAGEEELFVISAVKRGMDCRFFNIEIGDHPHTTTGSKITPEVLQAQGFIIAAVYPYSFLPRLILKAYRNGRLCKQKFLPSFRYLLKGAIKQKKDFSKISKSYRW